MTEPELISRILTGEEALFARIVERYSGYVWAICASYVRNHSDCEDVAQEVFVQCYRHLDSVRNPAAFPGWLAQLTRRQCLMWLRASTRRDDRLARFQAKQHAMAGQRGAEDDMEARERLFDGLRSAIEQLPPDYREALMLCYAEGYSAEQAAAFLGIRPAAMRKRIERGKKLLKDRIWDHVEPALAQRKHRAELAGGIMAGIPLGQAPWLTTMSAAGAAASAGTGVHTVLIGGMLMFKKIAIGVAVLAIASGVIYWKWDRVHQDAQASMSLAKSAEAAPANSQIEPASPASETAASSSAVPKPGNEDATVPAVDLPKAPEPEKTRPRVKPAVVGGVVMDIGKNPVSGAKVHIEIGRDDYGENVYQVYDTTTNGQGVFSVTGIEAFGDANVYASANGFAMKREFIKLASGSKEDEIEIILEPADFVVAGRVVSEDDQPVPGATVDTMYFGYDNTGLLGTMMNGITTGVISNTRFVYTITDEQGAFTLPIPADGLCDLRVTKDDYSEGFFPKIKTGSKNLELVLKAGGAIAGKVTDNANKPVAGAKVHVRGEVKPGGMSITFANVQMLPTLPVTVVTNEKGEYRAENLGSDFTYTVKVLAMDEEENELEKQDPLRGYVVNMMDEFSRMIYENDTALAKKGKIRVRAGKTTAGVDLQIGKNKEAVIYGKVTDKTTGEGVCPVVVVAVANDAEAYVEWSKGEAGAMAVTKADGSYEMKVGRLDDYTQFQISHVFMTEGGSSWDQPDEVAEFIELKPGDKREVNLKVDAPLTVPVRYVNTSQQPLEGIAAAIRMEGASGGCGGALHSDADGLVTFHGIRAGILLQAVAWDISGNNIKTLGVSAPFTGKPGETVPEITVVCRAMGGAEATLVYEDGKPVANMNIACNGDFEDPGLLDSFGQLATDGNGLLHIPEALPEGLYRNVHFGFVDPGSSQQYGVAVGDVTITPGAITNLGVLNVGPDKDMRTLIANCDYGHATNEMLAEAYTPEGIGAVTDPVSLMMTGMALYDAGQYAEALDVFQHMEQMSDGARWEPVAVVWEGQMLDLLGRRDEAVAQYERAAAEPNLGSVRHDQFGLEIDAGYARERMQTPFTRVENNMP